ncbi:ATP-binding protein, CobQ/MinD/ParA family [Cryptosporangium arvum DSM 44712]|uniref:ATP-binding protein, CobQ/MinD/ParA family n=2 Tax=Cryptosporangium TaxID=65502 RepID=A0A010ZQL2_9ACTN|nr:ATP-binding protein, CobQ/MinD/ParA family [Cryptosporangium arvum DSM 44712]
MCMANIAWILASRGKRVLAVDWDLESPGLHKYLEPFLLDKELRNSDGVIDIFRNYALEAIDSNAPDIEPLRSKYADISEDSVTLWDTPFDPPNLFRFLPAGKQNSAYAQAVGTFNWDAFYNSAEGLSFFEELRRNFKSDEYDYVLIDSRTGFSDNADICTLLLPDIVVVGYAMNDQAIQGGAWAAQHIVESAEREVGRRIKVLPVAMRVDPVEQARLKQSRAFARAAFQSVVDRLDLDDPERYWAETQIPYKSNYAFEELLAPIEEPASELEGLLVPYQRLAAIITEGEVTEAHPMKESTRQALQGRYARVPIGAPQTAFVAYAPRDRAWADWIRTVLYLNGIRVVERRAGQKPGDPIPDVDRVVALISSHWESSLDARALSIRASEKHAESKILAIRIDEGSTLPPWSEIPGLNLIGFGPDDARKALLAHLDRHSPADRLPHDSAARYPRTRPSVIELPPNLDRFVGRDDVLEELRNKLAPGTTPDGPVALVGLSGTGKSQTALEFALRFQADYDVIWWVPAISRISVETSLRDLDAAVAAANESEQSVPESASSNGTTPAESGEHPPRRVLLIFDSADTPDAIIDLLPKRVSVHSIVTSKDTGAWASVNASTIALERFTRPESVQLLKFRAPWTTDREADRVADALGDFPVAIEHAARWLNPRRDTPSAVNDYLRLLAEWRNRMRADADQPDEFLPAAVSWRLSIENLASEYPAAALFLEYCSFLSPNAIALALLERGQVLAELEAADPGLRDFGTGKILRVLRGHGLARQDFTRRTIFIHPLMQAAARSRLTAEERENRRAAILDALARFAPPDTEAEEVHHDATYDELQDHITPSGALRSDRWEIRRWLVNQVRYLWRTGRWEEACGLGERLLDTWSPPAPAGHENRFERWISLSDDERVDGNQQELAKLRLRMGVQVANAYRSEGRYRDSYELDRKILAVQSGLLGGPQHPQMLMTLRSFGADLRGLGRFREGWEDDQATYAYFRELFGVDHPDTLSAANNLAEALLLIGSAEESLQQDRDTYDRRRRVLGDGHRHTWFSYGNIGTVYRELDRVAESMRTLRDTAEECRKRFGDDAPETLRARRSLAVSWRRLGDPELARSLSQATVRRYTARYGLNNPDTLSCRLNLATDLHVLGDYEAAVAMGADVLEGYREVFGDNHPFTFICQCSLATFRRATGDFARSGIDAEASWNGLYASLGDRHPILAGASINYANVLVDLGDFTRAKELDSHARSAFTRLYGNGHSYSEIALRNHLDSQEREEGGAIDRPTSDRGEIDLEVPAF